MNDDVKAFMLIPVTINVAGEMTRLSEGDAAYPLPEDMSNTVAAVRIGDEQWKVSMVIEKVQPQHPLETVTP